MTDSLPVRLSRPVSDSQHVTSELIMPHDANILGHAFGGAIMAMVDKAAAVSAFRHARSACVTASIDRVDFREPIHVGDLVTCLASVNFAGTTSMEIGVRVEDEDLISGARRHTNTPTRILIKPQVGESSVTCIRLSPMCSKICVAYVLSMCPRFSCANFETAS